MASEVQIPAAVRILALFLYLAHGVAFGVDVPHVEWINNCPARSKHRYGNITLMPLATDHMLKTYDLNYKSQQCYGMHAGYKYQFGALTKVLKEGCPISNVFFRKHCLVLKTLKELPLGEWIAVLDGDTGVINPTRCLEEFLAPDVDLVMYERFHNGEIMAGNYMIKHSQWSIKFLEGWISYATKLPSGFSNHDNGALHLHLLKTLFPEDVGTQDTCLHKWQMAHSLRQYQEYVFCVKQKFGSQRRFPHVLIHHRAHGWAIDAWVSHNKVQPWMLMHHAIKNPQSSHYTLGDVVCDRPLPIPPHQYMTEKAAVEEALKVEINQQKSHGTSLRKSYIRECLPHCVSRNVNTDTGAIQ